MKIRNGFISNSSSSSFVLVGISRWKKEKLFAEIFEALGFTEKEMTSADEDTMNPKGFDVSDQGEFSNDKNGISLFVNDSEVSCIGLNIFDDLKNDKTVNEMKKEFMKKIKALGVEIKQSDIEFINEEFGWG